MLDFVARIAIILDHFAQTAHLTLDTVQSLEQLLFFIDRSHNVQTIIFEIVFHERTVLPDKTALLSQGPDP
ncbi:MAG TPA: hypothetical protein VM715_02675 [Candidatus Acidoferrum sp.]|nr:hypothetical protein [Candidatus Acidoferrum sp.]